jgi:hypothetical protein
MASGVFDARTSERLREFCAEFETRSDTVVHFDESTRSRRDVQ